MQPAQQQLGSSSSRHAWQSSRLRTQRCAHWQDVARRRQRPAAARATGVQERSDAQQEERQQQQPLTLVETRGRVRRHFDVASGRLLSASEAAGEAQPDFSSNAVDWFKGFLLPRGFPDAVTDDYITYQLWAFPCHIFGWMSHSLATSSLLKAVGVHPDAAGTAGATAAVKWITKDGIGALGRLLVGGRLGPVFDEDPKRWRMLAEALATAGMSLEIATAFAPPQAFLLLAGAGNLALAAGKGMGKPAFRIIQTHFAAANNVGDVAAKEEVWEVGAQMLGLASSIAVLKAIEASHNPYNVLWVWALCQSAHVGFRYGGLASLRLVAINHKRGCTIAAAHVAGRPVPGPAEAGAAEGRVIMLPPSLVAPRLCFGCSLEALLQFATAAGVGHSHRHQRSDSHNSSDAWSGSSSEAASSVGDGSGSSGNDSDASISSGSGDRDSTSSSGVGANGSNGSTGSGAMGTISSSSGGGGGGGSGGGSGIASGGVLAPLLPASGGSLSDGCAAAAALVNVYSNDDYVLTWRGGAGRAMLREDAPPTAPLQALWQAAKLEADGVQDATMQQLKASAVAAREALPRLLSEAQAAGWNIGDIPIRGGACRLGRD